MVWSAYDGYDYPFQVNYQEKWMQIVNAFRECCDAYPDIKWSLEYKPTDRIHVSSPSRQLGLLSC